VLRNAGLASKRAKRGYLGARLLDADGHATTPKMQAQQTSITQTLDSCLLCLNYCERYCTPMDI
jgi:hypothetical protein